MRPWSTRLIHGEGIRLWVLLGDKGGDTERLGGSPDGVGPVSFAKEGRGLAGGLGEEEDEAVLTGVHELPWLCA